MNFQKIHPIIRGKELLDHAFRKARQKSVQKDLQGNWLEIIRKKEALKLDVAKDNLTTPLQKMLVDFPDLTVILDFYISLMEVTLDFVQMKKSLGTVQWGVNQLRNLHKSYVGRIFKVTAREDVQKIGSEFYGRASSVVKQIDPALTYLEQCRKIMRTYPDVKELPTICIYGFPNVGKSTLLNKLTGTKAEVAAYAFTTKSINVGYALIDGKKIQFMDVPGTLDRKEKMNVIELQADLVLEELADVVIYVFDISGYSGYSVKNQEQLLQNLGKGKKDGQKRKIIVYLSKIDMLRAEQVKAFAEEYGFKESELVSDAGELKERIGRMLA